MSTRRAVIHKSQDLTEVSDVPYPKLRRNYIIVKTKAVALNPTDWKSLSKRPSPGSIAGCDYAGVVTEIGKAVTTPFKVGDRVAGFVRGGWPDNHENGAFAEYLTAKGDMQIRIPDSMSFEEGATLGVGITTVGQALYQALELPLPPAKVEEPTTILICGGSTATGTLAIQYAKLSGLRVITTASPRYFSLLKKLGADEIFDYNDPEVGKKIRKATNDKLRLVFDTIGEHGTPAMSAEAIGSSGGLYANLLVTKNFPRSDVYTSDLLAYTALGEKMAQGFPAIRADWEFGVKFWRLTEELFNNGKIKVHPIEVRPGGLEGIQQGLMDVKDGKISGKKLVYRIE